MWNGALSKSQHAYLHQCNDEPSLMYCYYGFMKINAQVSKNSFLVMTRSRDIFRYFAHQFTPSELTVSQLWFSR